MSQYKDFQGKSLDDAISEACAYYGVEREKLEIEIISDAKTGIFGLVGVKKASIRAARAQLPERMLDLTQNTGLPDGTRGARSEPQAGQSGMDDEGNSDQAPHAAGETGQRRKENASDRARRPEEKGRPGREARSASGRDKRAEPDGGLSPASGDRSSDQAGVALAEAGKNGRGARVQAPARKPSGNAQSSGAHPDEARAGEPGRQPAAGRDTGRRPAKGHTNGSGPAGPDAEGQVAAPARGRNRRDNGRDPRKDEGRQPRRESTRAADQGRPGEPSPTPEDYFSAELSLEARDEFPEFALEGCNQDELFAVVCEVIHKLVEPIVGVAPCTVEIHGSRVRASVDCGDASGLLVGREGQTLASVQYLAARIIAKRIGGSLRLQIDAGNYRERQDDRLKELALSLAERAKATRRPQSTRPLSAYQRRIVHLALEEDDAVQTHSKGEGTQRRVIIQPKRAPGRNGNADAPSSQRNGDDSAKADGSSREAGLPGDGIGNWDERGDTSPPAYETDSHHSGNLSTGSDFVPEAAEPRPESRGLEE